MMASKRVAEGLFGRVQWRDSPRHGLWRETRRSANSSWPCPHRKPQLPRGTLQAHRSASMVTKRTGFIGGGSRTRAPHGKVSHRQPQLISLQPFRELAHLAARPYPQNKNPPVVCLGRARVDDRWATVSPYSPCCFQEYLHSLNPIDGKSFALPRKVL